MGISSIPWVLGKPQYIGSCGPDPPEPGLQEDSGHGGSDQRLTYELQDVEVRLLKDNSVQLSLH